MTMRLSDSDVARIGARRRNTIRTDDDFGYGLPFGRIPGTNFKVAYTGRLDLDSLDI